LYAFLYLYSLNLYKNRSVLAACLVTWLPRGTNSPPLPTALLGHLLPCHFCSRAVLLFKTELDRVTFCKGWGKGTAVIYCPLKFVYSRKIFGLSMARWIWSCLWIKVNRVFGSEYCIPMSQAVGVPCSRGCRILLSTGFPCNHLLTVLKVCPL